MEFIIGLGLGIVGIISNNLNKEDNLTEDNIIKPFNQNYLTNYRNNIIDNANTSFYNSISNLHNKSIEDNPKVINNIYRDQIDPINIIKKNKINNMLNKDINMIKNLTYNNIDNMNSRENFENTINTKNTINNKNTINDYVSSNSSDNDSVFSDNYDTNAYINNNINTRVIKSQDKFLEDIVSNLSGDSSNLEDEDNNYNQNNDENELEDQFNELSFNHKGLPGTFGNSNSKQVLNIFNDKIKFNPQSNFDGKEDGRYNATPDMTHNNMAPFFSSKTYGYNPMFNKEMDNYSVRKVELFSGSDQNPQFKHKSEVGALFDPVVNKVESVTGQPVFTDFFESRYIPSDKRQSEKPFQPLRVTPGLNLGYTETGNTGLNDLYRSLPKTVDQLRTVDNPKVSYKQPIIPGQKGDNRGIIGDLIQKGPDRFFYNSPDSMMPTNGDHVAPAIYGKYLAPQTSRSLNPDNIHLNPAKQDVDHNTPEYLQGQFHSPFKKTQEDNGPRNIQYDTRGQIINQDTYKPSETNRQDTNYIYLGPTSNKSEVPLVNFLNFIPEITKKEILLADNGNQNITNISNSIKSYLYNAINAIPDQNMRSLLSEKIIITNNKGNSEKSYLFNANNAVSDQNMRNLSEDNLILANLSNHEQGYLFNNLNSIPDTNLRNIVNTLFKSGGLNFKGNHDEGYLYNHMNSIPDATLRELIENIININNVTGPSGQVKGYLINYLNSINDTTLKELTENNIMLNSVTPIQMKSYLYNYINSVPDATLTELTENTKYIVGQKGNHDQQYIFDYKNAIPDSTLRDLIGDIININNINGNHKSGYLINYLNTISDSTMREFTENNKNLSNMNPIQVKGYLINYLNSIPQETLKQFTENTQNLTGMSSIKTAEYFFNYDGATPDITSRNTTENTQNLTGMSSIKNSQYTFNYEGAIPDNTNRNMIENNKNLTGMSSIKNSQYAFNYEGATPDNTNRSLTTNTKNLTGAKSVYSNKEYMFNYKGATPDNTNRNLTENTKNITGAKGIYSNKEYLFNYEGGTPDNTNRNLTENTKNIAGTMGNNIQLRSRLDADNALLNTAKEIVAEGRDPVPVKDNRGPQTMFTEYTFCDDVSLSKPLYGGNKIIAPFKNELYQFSV